MKPIIRVEDLSKRYRIGVRADAHPTLREALAGAARAPFRRLRRARDGQPAGTFWALDGVSFEIAPGDVVGIIGRNGAGKSTLLKILSRVTDPTRGRVEIYGRISSLLEVGTGFHPELTGRENIFLNGAILGMHRAEIERKFDEIVAFSGVDEFIDTPVKRYSSGMYVRLAFAVAAHLEPEILIVDEVLAVGDTQFQKKCLGKIGEVARGGRTVLFVSHNLRSIAQLCTSCIWIERGRVVERGEPSRLAVDYLSSAQPEHADGVVTREMHYHEPIELSFQRVTMLDYKGRPSASHYFGSPLIFRVEFHVRERLDDGRLGLVIQRQDETVVCAFQHTDGGRFGLLDLPPGDYVARLSVDVPLAPGRYSVGLFAKPRGGYWTSGDRSMDYVPHALTFYVEDMSNDGRAVLPTDAVMLPVADWSIDTNAYSA